MNIVGGKIPANVTMDGVDMAPILFNDGKVWFTSLLGYVYRLRSRSFLTEQQRLLYFLSWWSKQDSRYICNTLEGIQSSLLFPRVIISVPSHMQYLTDPVHAVDYARLLTLMLCVGVITHFMPTTLLFFITFTMTRVRSTNWMSKSTATSWSKLKQWVIYSVTLVLALW